MKAIEGGITAPKGFRAAGVAAGIKPGSTKRDCALLVSDAPGSVAGMFTTNVLKAPPVSWCEQVCSRGEAQAVFVNSGNANACTGEQGIADAKTMAAQVGAGLELAAEQVCVCSTGVIGVLLPMERIAAGVTGCIEALSTEGSPDAAEAIMTTDTVRKEMAVEVALPSGTIRLGAIAKGSGMIMPNMATMICVLTTDAQVSSDILDGLLRNAVEVSFNRICVDNDMSTSDTVLCLANGASSLVVASPEDQAAFGDALTGVCQEMARELVLDGEGATKFVEIVVEGAQSDDEAKSVARAIATSQLCKTAFFGQDPNWGRFACAAGYAGVTFAPEDLCIWLDDIQIVADGMAAEYLEEDAAAVMAKPSFSLRVAIGKGKGSTVYWTSDLSHDYVSINADYRS